MYAAQNRPTPGEFEAQGYTIQRQFCPESVRKAVIEAVTTQLSPVIAPAEFEADVGYPGPSGRTTWPVTSVVRK